MAFGGEAGGPVPRLPASENLHISGNTTSLIAPWEKLINITAKVISGARKRAFQLAEAAGEKS